MGVMKVMRKKAVTMKSRIHFSHPAAKKTKTVKKLKPINFVSPDVASALDHARVNDRNAIYILAVAAKSIGQDPFAVVLNKESIRHTRRNHRTKFAAKIQMSFSVDASIGLLTVTVHWDGKLLPALTGKVKVDRLAAIVSENDTVKQEELVKLRQKRYSN